MIIFLLVLYGICASITTFDIRIIQARKQGIDEPELPKWTLVFYWVEWIVLIGIAIISWKIAIGAYVIKFILKVLPVLEIIGNILMAPFKKREHENTR